MKDEILSGTLLGQQRCARCARNYVLDGVRYVVIAKYDSLTDLKRYPAGLVIQEGVNADATRKICLDCWEQYRETELTSWALAPFVVSVREATEEEMHRPI